MRTLAAFSLLLALLFAPAVARAADWDWTPKDTMLELTYFGVQTVDWMQTRRFLKDHSGLETNPILGPRPSAGALVAYNAGTMVLHAAVAYALPHPYRSWWQYVWIGGEAWQVGSNVRTAGGFRIALP